MKLLSWLLQNRHPQPPASLTVDAAGVRYRPFRGPEVSVRWGELEEVAIETTDKGPFAEDFFAVLKAPTQTLRIPHEVVGFELLLQYMKELPGFDSEAVVEATGSTGNAVFPCWKRGAAR
jgi:hypothetical protein